MKEITKEKKKKPRSWFGGEALFFQSFFGFSIRTLCLAKRALELLVSNFDRIRALDHCRSV